MSDIDLHPDWLDALRDCLRTSGRRAGSRHVDALVRSHAFGETPEAIAEMATILLGAIEAGDIDLLAFFAPEPVPLSGNHGWTRHYDKTRNTCPIPREQTPPWGKVSDDDRRALVASYADGLTLGFHGGLLVILRIREERSPGNLERLRRIYPMLRI